MMRKELRGREALEEMARQIYGDTDPTELFSDSSPMRFETKDDMDFLVMKMPFVSGDKIELFRLDAATLMVHVGSQKRNIQLPDSMVSKEIAGAEFKGDELIISFKRVRTWDSPMMRSTSS